MKVVVQRASEGSVVVEGETVGAIAQGLVILVGIEARDTLDDVKWIGQKLWNMRLWPDQDGKQWMESASARNYGLLVISQFTLQGRLKGNKPDFRAAMKPEKAELVYNLLVKELNMKAPKGATVATGKFGAKMAVHVVNDGPVTITLDSQTVRFPRKIPLPVPPGGGGTAASTSSQEVDVPWVAPTGEVSQEKVQPLTVDADGMIGPPVGALPPNTPMTTMMYTIPDGVKGGDVADVPLPSGMSVKVLVPADKAGGDFLQIQVPSALMDPEFKAKQEIARRMQEQGVAVIDFKVPDDKKGGDECSIRLPSGMEVKVTVPDDKVAGDILQVRVPRAALDPRQQNIVSFKVPEGKVAGDQCDVRLNNGHVLKVVIPEGKKAGDVVQLRVPATPKERIKVTIPEGKGPGDKVRFTLPSGMTVTAEVQEGKKAGDVMELEVPRPFLDPKFREKQELKRKQMLEMQKQRAAAEGGAAASGLEAIKEETSGSSGQETAPKKPAAKKKSKKKKKK